MLTRTLSAIIVSVVIAIAAFLTLPTISNAQSVADIQARINELLAQIKQLQTQINEIKKQGNASGGPNHDVSSILSDLAARADKTSGACDLATTTPVIRSFTGTSTLMIGQKGVWTIDASSTRVFMIDWKDGERGGEQAYPCRKTSVEHAYRQAGTYSIVLTAKSKNGTATATTTVVVLPKPAPVIFTFTGTSTLMAGEHGTWTIDASSDIRLFRIDWNDGERGGEQVFAGKRTEIKHKYKLPGVYNIVLTGIGPGGTTSATSTVHVQGPAAPVINSFTGPGTLMLREQGIWYIDSTNVTKYTIDWKDGERGGEMQISGKRSQISHRYMQPGTYSILLTAKGPGGVATSSATVVVSTSTTASIQVATAYEAFMEGLAKFLGL